MPHSTVPDPSPHCGSDQLAAITQAKSIGSAARATTELLSEYLGAAETRACIFPDTPRETKVCWSSRTGTLDAATDPWKPILLPLCEQVMTSGTAASVWGQVGDQELIWSCVPVFAASGAIGCLLAGFQRAAQNAIPSMTPWAATLGLKLGELDASARSRMETERSNGWFRTMDGQLRILERERQKLSALVNQTDAAVFVARHDGTLTWMNATMAERYDLAVDPARVGNEQCGVICGGGATGCDDCPVRLVRKGQTMVHQERTETRDGELRHMYVSAFPVRTPEGAVDEVMVMLQDLTDLETLRRSEARYHLLFERSTDAIVMADPKNLSIVMANRQARSLLGLNLEAPDRPTLLDLHPGDEQPQMEARYRRLAAGKPLENVEVEVLDRDGESLTCNACGALFDLDGTDAVLIEFRDVTQVRRLQLELARADHLITLGTMNAGIAHEFKNRLAPLRAFAQLIAMKTPSEEKLQVYSPLIIQEVDRLTVLVRDILDYARPQNPKMEAVELVEFVRELAAEYSHEFRPVLRERSVVCDIEVGCEQELFVRADREQIRRAFLNLFKNSLEACGDDSDPRIVVWVGEINGQAVVKIQDSGCGMDALTLERIFDPFFSTKGPKGTGLGMCIVKSLVEANNAQLTVESTPGSGTTASMCFPTRALDADAERAA